MIDDFKPPQPKERLKLDSNRSFELPQPQSSPIEPATAPTLPGAKSSDATDTQADSTPIAGFTLDHNEEQLLPEHASPDPVMPSSFESGMGEGNKPPKTSGKPILLFGKWPIARKKFFIILAVLLVLLVGGGAAAFALTHNKTEAPKKNTTVTKKAEPAPVPITSPLTGLTVDSKDKTTWPVIGAMVENSGDARPQSGLKEAGVVYEAIAEAGITRFLALYQESRPGNLGPIRSSRPYYLDWAMAFDASYAHVGGSPDALARIKEINVKDLDQFYNPVAYHRITTRYAPHNVYTGVQQLVDLSGSKGWTTSQFTPFARKADKPFVASAATAQPNGANTNSAADTRTAANSIDFSISSDFYNAHYDYDPASNLYKRSEGGAPHIDANTNTQLTPKVVIALVMSYGLMSDGYHSTYNTQGTGKMYVFQDGTVTTGTWSKGEPKSQFDFKDDNGKTIALDAGQTWISVVSDAGKVIYR